MHVCEVNVSVLGAALIELRINKVAEVCHHTVLLFYYFTLSPNYKKNQQYDSPNDNHMRQSGIVWLVTCGETCQSECSDFISNHLLKLFMLSYIETHPKKLISHPWHAGGDQVTAVHPVHIPCPLSR